MTRLEHQKVLHVGQTWRDISLVPTPKELSAELVDVSTNCIDGPYRSVDEYLETQYDLFREDAVSTLRDGIKVAKAHPYTADTQHFHVYENVRYST